jgi:hypothetical protein
VSVETGIQNIGIAQLIIHFNFESPEVDYALSPLMGLELLTLAPVFVTFVVKFVVDKIRGKKNSNATEERDIEESVELKTIRG